ncbi:MAG: 2TM domain-containing protein [Saprospiraceae bacterium]|nr:2TM domain-containing protein [Saprospiraceae bacterium]
MENLQKAARERVKKKKEFYQFLAAYVGMCILVVSINLITSFGEWWFIYPVLCGGIGVAIHFFMVFGIPGLVNYDGWEERAYQEELERLKKNKTYDKQNPSEDKELELEELQKEVVERTATKYDDSELV